MCIILIEQVLPQLLIIVEIQLIDVHREPHLHPERQIDELLDTEWLINV